MNDIVQYVQDVERSNYRSLEEFALALKSGLDWAKDDIQKAKDRKSIVEGAVIAKLKQANIEKITIPIDEYGIALAVKNEEKLTIKESAIDELNRKLWSDSKEEREEALRCRAGGQTPWNKKNVQKLNPEYVEVTKTDKLILKEVNLKYAKQKQIKGE